MGGSISHFFKEDFKSAEDAIKGVFGIIGGTLGGGNYSDAIKDFRNYGYDVKNAFTGGNSRAPLSASEQIKRNLNRAINPDNSWNKVNWQSMSKTITNAHYGSSTGVTQTPPSNLMAISNPSTKMAIATSRGSQRAALHVAGAMVDKGAVDTFAKMQPPAGTSDNINSGGGEGPSTSGDANDHQFSS